MNDVMGVLASASLFAAASVSVETPTMPRLTDAQPLSVETRPVVAPEDRALYSLLSGSSMKPSANARDETRFFEAFYPDGRWNRTDYMAAPINKRGIWTIKAPILCVNYSGKLNCRKVTSYGKGTISMESWRTKVINTYVLYKRLEV